MSVLGKRPMWLFCFFDLPVKSKEEKKCAARFRKKLLKDGYFMMQFSVYARPCIDFDRLKKHQKRLKTMIPPQGSVRSLAVTDLQFGKMEELINTAKLKKEKEYMNTDEILLF